MKKKIYIWGVMLLGIALYVSCVDDYIVSKQGDGPAYLSIAEAQEFFENGFTAGQTRSASAKKDKGKLYPGEFTPQWEHAQVSQNKGIGSVDIPLLAEYKYKAIRCEFENGKSKAYIVNITQKLIVLKSKYTEMKVQYLLSLIPDADYYQKNKGDLSAKFIHAGEKNDYSGLAVYSHVSSGKTVSVSKYKNGDLIANVYLPSGKGTLDSRIKEANELLESIKVPRMKSTTTRSFGEEEPEIFYCSLCGNEVDACDCWSVEEECKCGSCDLCLGRLCFWCGEDPCICHLFCPVCGYLDCICEVPVECPYCGDTNCNGECQDVGCGGCGNCPECGSISGPDIKPKDLFRNSGLTEENWQVLEDMLDKIAENCMGEALIDGLYEALDGGTLSIEFSDDGGGGFHFDGSTAGISIGMDNVESNVFFHEMWHAYQAYQETQTSYTNSLMNQEIEAHYAQYLYLQSLPEYSESKWEEGYKYDERLLGIALIDIYIDGKGNLLNSADSGLFDTYTEFNLVPSFMKLSEYKDYSYDNHRSALTNFSNLQILTINC